MDKISFEREPGRSSVQDIFADNQHFFRFFQSPFFGAAIYSLPDLAWIAINDTFCSMLGYEREEIKTFTWRDLTHPDDLEENLRLFDQAISTSGADSYSMEKRFIRKDGGVLYAEIYALCCRTEDGTPDYSILLVQDVTSRKAAEREVALFNQKLERRVRARTRALRESEARLEALVNNLADGVISIDRTGIIKSVNPAAAAMFGYEPSELLDENVKILVPDPHHDAHDGYLAAYHDTGIGHVINNFRELEGRQKSGDLFPIELSVSDVRVNGQQFFVGIVRDITERAALTESLVTARVAAERANEAKSSFLASMSHELRTPLNAILGFAQMLQYDQAQPLTPAQNNRVENILFGGRQLLTLVNDVLDLAQIEANRLTLSPEEVSPSEVIESCIRLSEPLATANNVSLVHVPGGREMPNIVTDCHRFEQVLINLISNAIKFNTAGGRVEVSTEVTKSDFVRVSVKDTGIGISTDDDDKIFEMFHRGVSDHTTAHDGMGIGLSVVKQLLDRMGGRVGATRNEDVGSTFWIELPIAGETDVIFWSEDIQTGIDDLDRDHVRAIAMINRLIGADEDADTQSKLVSELIEYTRSHFKMELNLSPYSSTKAMAEHEKIHIDLRNKLETLTSIARGGSKGDASRALQKELRELWLRDISADRELIAQVKEVAN